MWDYDGRGPDGLLGVLLGIGWSITGFIAFLIWIGVLILLVRFLLIGTRAAKLYLSQNGQDSGLFPRRPEPPATPAPAAAPSTTTAARSTSTAPTAPVAKAATTKPVTKPATRPRKPTTPPTTTS
jgi:hypothetical protein